MADKAKQKEAATPVSTAKKAVATSPTYTIEEFAAATNIFDNTSPDIIRAALKTAGKDTATVEEAKKIVNAFKKKGV